MDYLTAFLLSHCGWRDDHAFVQLVALMKERKYRLEELYRKKLPLLQVRFFALSVSVSVSVFIFVTVSVSFKFSCSFSVFARLSRPLPLSSPSLLAGCILPTAPPLRTAPPATVGAFGGRRDRPEHVQCVMVYHTLHQLSGTTLYTIMVIMIYYNGLSHSSPTFRYVSLGEWRRGWCMGGNREGE